MRLGRAMAAALVLGAGWLLASAAVAATPDGPAAAETPWPTKGWEVSTPEAQGLDSGALAQLVDAVGTYPQDSLLVVRHGRIVVEAYYAPYEAGIRHDQRSVTKSVVSTLTAIALKEGLLDSVDHPVVDLFSDKPIANLDDRKRAMTVQHLLDMTSGIDWQERVYTPDESIMRMYRSPDHTQFVLDQPMSDAPGARFYYDSGNPYVLSALITRKTGQSAFDFAKARLFEPLGISHAGWVPADAQGVTDGESGLFLTPRDMAKIGYLYLHDGAWDGQQIIPAAWVERVREGPVTAGYGFHYANLWWSLPDKGAYMARGLHSQVILVLPQFDVVAVMTGILRNDAYYPPERLIDDIARAVKSDQPLPPDAVAGSLLAASIRQAATERPSPVGEAPELARTISGKVYRFGDNVLEMKTLSLDLVGPTPSWEILAASGKPDRSDERFAGPLGLDGFFRKNAPTSHGIDAVKGRWLDAHTFAFERRVLGHGETQLWTLAFDGSKVDLRFENTDGFKAELTGEAQD